MLGMMLLGMLVRWLTMSQRLAIWAKFFRRWRHHCTVSATVTHRLSWSLLWRHLIIHHRWHLSWLLRLITTYSSCITMWRRTTIVRRWASVGARNTALTNWWHASASTARLLGACTSAPRNVRTAHETTCRGWELARWATVLAWNATRRRNCHTPLVLAATVHGRRHSTIHSVLVRRWVSTVHRRLVRRWPIEATGSRPWIRRRSTTLIVLLLHPSHAGSSWNRIAIVI